HFSFFLYRFHGPRHLHSFPTRRSSDLSRGLRRGLVADRQPPVRSDEMAGIAVRIALQVILVLRLGFPEVTHRLDLRHHLARPEADRKSTRLNSSHVKISYAVFCLKKKK